MKMNSAKTVFLMTLLTVLLVLVGDYLGGSGGAQMFFMFALIMNLGSYWFSDKIVLKMYRAQEVTQQNAPELVGTVEKLARQAEIPMPKVYITPQQNPNAFATGRNPSHAAVAVTQGILQALSPQELEGVLAHELAHVKNRDILIGTIAATIAGAITMLATMARWAALFGGLGGDDDDGGGALGAIIMMIVAPLAAMLIQMAISRSREYQADASGAKICGAPLNLASALQKLDARARRVPMDANPATAHMFIVNPLSGKSMMKFFSTHPPMPERVERLQEIARDVH
jgi:heat shock protein HtpX